MPAISSLSARVALDDAVLVALLEHGRLDLAALTRHARRGSATLVDAAVVAAMVEGHPLVVRRPDGSFEHLAHVLDGVVLTHRVRGALRGATELWVGPGLVPLEMLCLHRGLPLEGGGEVRGSTTEHAVLVGPPGWLPDASRRDLLALRWRDGVLSAALLDPADLAPPPEHEHVRGLLAERVTEEMWWRDHDPMERQRLLTVALGLARLQDPDLLSTPHPPLDELLYEPLEDRRRELWRDVATASQGEGTTTLVLDGVPVQLEQELRRRAEAYGMVRDQLVVALLGHLAWRTPFAEDMEPWRDWLPQREALPSRTGSVVSLRPVPDAPEQPPPAAG